MKKPKFESNADATLDRVRATYSQRGSEYADTWGTCRFLKMKAVAKELGSKIDERHYRALATAAFCDMKDERMSGGWKDDSMVDGIAYDASLVQEMRELKQGQKHVPETDFGIIERESETEWRELKIGEQLQAGDEWFDDSKKEWVKAEIISGPAGLGNRYRRRKGGEEKWRTLAEGEQVQQLDEFRYTDGWAATSFSGNRVNAKCVGLYRRRAS